MLTTSIDHTLTNMLTFIRREMEDVNRVRLELSELREIPLDKAMTAATMLTGVSTRLNRVLSIANEVQADGEKLVQGNALKLEKLTARYFEVIETASAANLLLSSSLQLLAQRRAGKLLRPSPSLPVLGVTKGPFPHATH